MCSLRKASVLCTDAWVKPRQDPLMYDTSYGFESITKTKQISLFPDKVTL